MKTFWDQRFAEHATVYGTAPNQYFKQFIDTRVPGSLLLPAEGEGRNALYAARKGWKVTAFDFSEVAREKALAAAEKEGLSIQYRLQNLADFKANEQFDAVALIYAHVTPTFRRSFHEQVYKSIRPGGFLVMEAFAKEQLQFSSGGPKEENMLYDAPTLCDDFPFLHLIECGQKEIILEEGPFHQGPAAVLRMIGQRL
ncbi:MAG: class I SAM-dependent methyltransferase [Chitinophagaceae bacterium]|nr:class I SAM-dependent methyltransferase [Chitinophagaceae bacterium]